MSAFDTEDVDQIRFRNRNGEVHTLRVPVDVSGLSLGNIHGVPDPDSSSGGVDEFLDDLQRELFAEETSLRSSSDDETSS